MAASTLTCRKRKLLKSGKLKLDVELETIKTLTKDILSSKKNCNKILNITQIAEDSREEVVCACIRAYHKIFCHYLEVNDLQTLKNEPDNSDNSLVKVRQWIKERYSDCVESLCEWLQHDISSIQELSLCTLMKFVEFEGKHPLDPGLAPSRSLSPLLEKIIIRLFSTSKDLTEIIQRFQEYLEYDDIRYCYMKYMINVVKQQVEEKADASTELHFLVNNLLTGMLGLNLASKDEKLSNFLVVSPAAAATFGSLKIQKALYSKLWTLFIKLQLTRPVYKKILIALPDKIIPNLQDPLLLSDWIISLYNHGGPISLMALNALFVLMNSYNLEYPDFYGRLYNIMGNDIFHTKYKARFFHLLDLFLQSVLLPTYTVAAFIKKLSRMALRTPPGGTLLIIELIINLLTRHDTCRALIHRDTPCDLDSDPYDPHQLDLKLCQATESSLWEVKSLQKHWYHRVALQALRIEKPLPAVESCLDDLLEVSIEELINDDVVKRGKIKKSKELTVTPDVPISHRPLSKLLTWETSSFSNLWSVQ